MRKQKCLMRAALIAAALAAPFLPTCRGAARCAPNAQPSTVIRVVGAFAAPVSQDSLAPQEPAAAQSPSNPAFPTHKVKVWTNEELIADRKPADIYIFEKEAQTAAQEMAAFSNLASCFAFGQPKGNTDETQKEIDATVRSIQDSEAAVAQARRALSTAPENLKLRNQIELSQRMSELNHARERLWSLQEHLQDLQKSPFPPSTTNQQPPAAQPQ
jgi:hypothetical protein